MSTAAPWRWAHGGQQLCWGQAGDGRPLSGPDNERRERQASLPRPPGLADPPSLPRSVPQPWGTSPGGLPEPGSMRTLLQNIFRPCCSDPCTPSALTPAAQPPTSPSSQYASSKVLLCARHVPKSSLPPTPKFSPISPPPHSPCWQQPPLPAGCSQAFANEVRSLSLEHPPPCPSRATHLPTIAGSQPS